MTNNENKIVIATRTKDEGTCDRYFRECVEKLEYLLGINLVSKGYIIYNNEDRKVNNSKIEVIYDKNPTRATAFNLVIKKLNDELNEGENKEKYNLLTFSKGVELQEENINEMLMEIENEDKTIVAGYRLVDNILSEKEYKQFANGDKNDNYGIAYQVPWNTCALWSKEFVYGNKGRKLIFDEICEDNQLGHLYVKMNGVLVETEFKGMEDGLAIAALVSNNKNLNLKFKLIDERLPWRVDKDFEAVLNHKIKMARKNKVLTTFIEKERYSIDELMKAKN